MSTKFRPPYLRYDNTEDLKKIDAEKKFLKQESAKKHIHDALAQPQFMSQKNEIGTNVLKLTPATEKVNPEKSIQKGVNTGIAKSASSSLNLKKERQIPVTVSPVGSVALGFNCTCDFSAQATGPSDYYRWSIIFKESNGSYSGMPQYLGYAAPSEPITFTLDYSTYYLMAYQQNGTATFKVQCEIILGGQIYPPMDSDEVTLDFSGAACVGIHNTTLSSRTFKGGENQAEPTLNVFLDAPAPPGGQTVYLSVSCANDTNPIGRILAGGESYVIPAGQISGGWSWFLGTRTVHATGKKFNIVIKVNASEATEEITLNKH